MSMSSYSPSNKAMSCPDVTTTSNETWLASSSLPLTPNSDACGCMVNASTCVPNDDLDPTKYSGIFDTICGSDNSLCTAINANGTSGKYGTFSMCSSQEKLAIVMGAYYQKNKASQQDQACDFKGAAKTQTGSGDSTSKCSAKAPSQGNNNGSSSSGGGSGNDSPAARGPVAMVSAVGLVAFLGGLLLL